MSEDHDTDQPGDTRMDQAASSKLATTTTMQAPEQSEQTQQQQQQPLFQLFTGMKEDLAARLPLYGDDFRRPKSIGTVINATIFCFTIQLIPALIFAELLDRTTFGNVSIAETLLSSGIMGILFALLGGQPLVLLGVTGPVALLLGTSYNLAAKFNAEYFPFFFWTCFWAGLLHMISAMIGLVSLVWKVTPFTSQNFELFIAMSFLYEASRNLIEPLYLGQGEEKDDRAVRYASLLIGVITFYIAWTLHFAETWLYFPRQFRNFLSSYDTVIALVTGTALSYLPGVALNHNGSSMGGGIDRVNVSPPWNWQPTADRSWVISPLQGIDAGGIFAAMITGFMFFLLFIIDHNVSSILTQSPKFNLKKPPAYHWDFFVLGLTFIPCAILGLPPGNGLIPQAPSHTRALCTRMRVTDRDGTINEVTHVEEQRWSALAQSLLMFVALSSFEVLSWIPRGCLFGIYFYLGRGALYGNDIWDRVTLCFMAAKKRPHIPVVRYVDWNTVQYWTAIQVILTTVIFGVAQFAEVGYIYPALLVTLCPIRSYILQRLFRPEDLKHLDPFGDETEDDYEIEKAVVNLTVLHDSVDSILINFPNRADFLRQDKPNNLHQRYRKQGESKIDIILSEEEVLSRSSSTSDSP
jgi:boron transporter